MSFEVTTVIVVLAIFGLFTWGAYKAEKVVAVKAKADREAQQNAVKNNLPNTVKAGSKGQKKSM